MFYNILYKLFANEIGFLNVLKYVTVRSVCAFLMGFVIVFLTCDEGIILLKRFQKNGQPIRDDGPKSHLETKKGIPTMGGIIIIVSVLLSSFLFGDLSNIYMLMCMVVMIGFGGIGLLDDFLKVSRNNSKGLSGRKKFLLQSIVGCVCYIACMIFAPHSGDTTIFLPFLKNVQIDLGYFFIVWTILIIVGSSNAVNLTDGLDGLALGPVVISSICFAIISYLVGNVVFSDYLHIHYVVGLSEVCVFLSALVGASLGFLWFNAPPAKIFMGDTGSIAIGGSLGFVSVISKHEIIFALIGGIFVLETISVIIQVMYFKMTGKRIFLMAPIHHHFEKKGWAESTVVFRFWIISIILGILGLASLKIR